MNVGLEIPIARRRRGHFFAAPQCFSIYQKNNLIKLGNSCIASENKVLMGIFFIHGPWISCSFAFEYIRSKGLLIKPTKYFFKKYRLLVFKEYIAYLISECACR